VLFNLKIVFEASRTIIFGSMAALSLILAALMQPPL
jgi:hypothetical protein